MYEAGVGDYLAWLVSYFPGLLVGFLLLVHFDCFPPTGHPHDAIGVRAGLSRAPTIHPMESNVLLTIGLDRHLFQNAIMFRLRSVGSVLRLRRRVHATCKALRFQLRVLSRRPRRRVRGNLVVLFNLILRVVKGKNGRKANALRTTLRVALRRITGRESSMRNIILNERIRMEKGRKFGRPFASLAIKVNRAVSLRVAIVTLGNRVATLMRRQSKAHCLFHEHVGLLVNDLGAFRHARVRIYVTRGVCRRDEHTHKRPVILMFFKVRDVRRTRQIMGVHADLARVVAIVLPLRVRTYLLMDLVVDLNRPLGVKFRLHRRFLLNSTTRNARIVTRASVLRVIRFTRSTRLTRLTSAHSGGGARVLPRPLREARRLTRLITGLLLRGNVKVAIGREDVMLIGRRCGQLSNLNMNARSSTLRALYHPLFLFLFSMGFFPAKWGRVRLPHRIARLDVFHRTRVGIRRQTGLPFLLRAFRDRPFRGFLFPLRVNLRHERRRTFTGPAKTTRRVGLIYVRRFMRRLHLVRVRAVPHARLLGVLCPCQVTSTARFRDYCYLGCGCSGSDACSTGGGTHP